MGKRGSMINYAVFSLALGGLVLLMFLRAGTIFGNADGRQQEYYIKDSALLLNAMIAVPGNTEIRMFYPVHDKIVEMEKDSFAIYEDGDELLKTHLSYRYAGTAESRTYQLIRPESLVFTKTDAIGINTDGSIDAFRCKKTDRMIRNLQIVNDATTRMIAEYLETNLEKGDFRVLPLQSLTSYRPMASDLTIMLAEASDNTLSAQVYYRNNLSHAVACDVINAMAAMKIKDLDTALFSVDPQFESGIGSSMDEKTILFFVPDDAKMRSPLRSKILDALSEVVG